MPKIGELFPDAHKPWVMAPATQRGHFQRDAEANPKWALLYKKYLSGLPEELPPFPGRMGIEIEIENMGAHATLFSCAGWEAKPDGSLRNNGIEFVSAALRNEQILPSIAGLYSWMKFVGSNPSFSWRTSVHVHLEVRQMEIEEFQKLLLLYLVFETSLFEFANPDRREQNIFCTPLTKTNLQHFSTLFGATSSDMAYHGIRAITGSLGKYSALNIGHVRDFGTVEFRHLRGDADPTQLGEWIALILKLGEAAMTIPKERIVSQIMSLNTTSDYRQFAEEVFGKQYMSRIILRPFETQISEGVTVAKQALQPATPLVRCKKTSGLVQFGELMSKKSQPDPLLAKQERAEVAVPRQPEGGNQQRQQFRTFRLRTNPADFGLQPGAVFIADEHQFDVPPQAVANERTPT